jgi:hypothetical protein
MYINRPLNRFAQNNSATARQQERTFSFLFRYLIAILIGAADLWLAAAGVRSRWARLPVCVFSGKARSMRQWGIYRFRQWGVYRFGQWGVYRFGQLEIYRFGQLGIYRFRQWELDRFWQWGIDRLRQWGINPLRQWGINPLRQ